ncbi:MAG TPA: Ig-like domain-containing protein [Phycisphaerae bacterium]|nr:Ig-like domain-containing protein [Phycisphaerae bacterium]HRR84582.1 Ig-like domain-containing protein [Phycisphaerae bacterium]
MFMQRLLSRTVLAVTVISLLCPMLMGPGCPNLEMIPLNNDPEALQPPDDSSGSSTPATLQIYAGPDREATVGSPITLSATVEGGEEPYLASWSPASALSDANTLSPTFVPPAEGEYEFTLTVADRKGLGGSRTVKVNALDHATLASLKWAPNFSDGGYQLIAAFTKPLDKPTAENVNNYRTTPKADDTRAASPREIVAKVSVKPTSATLSSDGLVVTLLFDSTTLARNTRFDISVSNGILGADGVAVSEIKGLPAAADSADTKAPTVVSRRWVTGTSVSDAETAAEDKIWENSGVHTEVSYSYILQVVFSETMDPVPAVNPAAYRIQEGTNRYAPAIVELANDGRTATLIFTDGPLSQESKLDVGLTRLRDMNGLDLVLDASKSVAANADDKVAPKIVAESVRFLSSSGEGYRVEITFDEPMDRKTCETAANYLLDGHAASTAELGSDGRRVVLTFEGLAATTNSKLSIPANKVKDINGVSLAAQNNLSILSADDPMTPRGVPTLTWLPGDKTTGYEIWAEFPLIMDRATVEDVRNWRITGTDLNPKSVVLHSTTNAAAGTIAGQTAKITFWDPGLTDQTERTRRARLLNRRTQLDVSVGASIRDISGTAIGQVSIPVVANENDVTGPRLVPLPGQTEAKPIWGDVLKSEYGKTHYSVSLAFSETMDSLSVLNSENYVLGGVRPTAIQLDLDGRTVVLTFAKLTTPLGKSDQLRLYSTLRDINGRANTSVTPMTILPASETTPPTIESLYWLADSRPYRVVVKFSEVMDRDSVEVVDKWLLLDYGGIDRKPTQAVLNPSEPTTLVLTFENGVFATDSVLSLDGEIHDINGNAYDGSGGGIVLPAAPADDANDVSAARLLSATWMVDSNLGYLVLVEFSEAIDADHAGTFTLDGIGPAWTMITDGGTLVVALFPDPATPAVFNRDSRIAISGLQDMSGNVSTTMVRNVAANPLDTLGPTPLRAMWAADYGDAPAEQGYQVIVVFSEVLDALTAQVGANYQITGTFSKPTEAALSPTDGRTVVLTFPPTVLYRSLAATDTLDASTGNSILDVNGVFGWQATVDITRNSADTTSPTVVAATAVGGTGVEILFSEALDRVSAEMLDNYVLTGNVYPTTALLKTDGRTVTLSFDQSVSGKNLRVSAQDTIADVNGNRLSATDVGPL